MATSNSRGDPPGAGRHDDDAVRQPSRLAHVVGHEQHRQVLRPHQGIEFVVEHVAGHRVERAERLVHQQDVGVLGERSGQCRPLAHSAGQLVGPLVREPVEMDRRDQLSCPSLAHRSTHACQTHGEFHVGSDGQPREQGRLLEHHRDASAHLDPPRRRCVQAGDQVQDGGLPAPRRTDETDELTGVDRQVDTIERDDAVSPGAEGLVDTAQLDDAHSPCTSVSPRWASTSFSSVRS